MKTKITRLTLNGYTEEVFTKTFTNLAMVILIISFDQMYVLLWAMLLNFSIFKMLFNAFRLYQVAWWRKDAWVSRHWTPKIIIIKAIMLVQMNLMAGITIKVRNGYGQLDIFWKLWYNLRNMIAKSKYYKK